VMLNSLLLSSCWPKTLRLVPLAQQPHRRHHHLPPSPSPGHLFCHLSSWFPCRYFLRRFMLEFWLPCSLIPLAHTYWLNQLEPQLPLLLLLLLHLLAPSCSVWEWQINTSAQTRPIEFGPSERTFFSPASFLPLFCFFVLFFFFVFFFSALPMQLMRAGREESIEWESERASRAASEPSRAELSQCASARKQKTTAAAAAAAAAALRASRRPLCAGVPRARCQRVWRRARARAAPPSGRRRKQARTSPTCAWAGAPRLRAGAGGPNQLRRPAAGGGGCGRSASKVAGY